MCGFTPLELLNTAITMTTTTTITTTTTTTTTGREPASRGIEKLMGESYPKSYPKVYVLFQGGTGTFLGPGEGSPKRPAIPLCGVAVLIRF